MQSSILKEERFSSPVISGKFFAAGYRIARIVFAKNLTNSQNKSYVERTARLKVSIL